MLDVKLPPKIMSVGTIAATHQGGFIHSVNLPTGDRGGRGSMDDAVGVII